VESPLWTEGASPWPHEREALAFVRARLPNHEPYRAWTNVEFIADDGSVNEVDLLVVTGQGLFLVEIKSWPGVLRGTGQVWRNRRQDGREFVMDHPLVLTNRKAKRLRSLLTRQPAMKREATPWVTPLVFLSSPELQCHLDTIAANSVCLRDQDPPRPGAPAVSPPPPLPGIVEVLKDPTLAGLRGTHINRPLSARLAEAITQAGLHPSNRARRAGEWELGDLLDEGPGWQDFLATRSRTAATRRVRVYQTASATTAEDEQRLRAEAEREFRLVQDLHHDGIARPLDLVQTERGPALLFDRTDGEERLDLWAATQVAGLPLDDRMELIRQLAEALAHAHAHRAAHRALTARSVLVRPSPSGGLPTLVIGHWQAGARELATRLTRTGSENADLPLGADIADRLAAAEQVYLGPEAFSVDDPDGVALDTFSLGALAFLLLSARPPAADLAERQAALQAWGGLDLGAAVDGLPEHLSMLVASATDPVPAQRPPIRELLDLLDETLEKLTAPSSDDLTDEAPRTDPLAAHAGEALEGGWRVERRLGSGSTAIALLCSRAGDPAPSVLKVAKDEGHSERLRDEARTLEKLHHAGIVELHSLERVEGRTTLRLTPAGDPDDKIGMTLADRLTAGGRVGLDLLERFGDDLIEILAYLESMGVGHRDIKPDNLGVRPRPGDRSLHLVLFDFSLARTPDTNLLAGTPGYLDPFLAERPARRWDPAAERYSVAATLHEMATGLRPIWGDGHTDPLHLADTEPSLDPDHFDPSVRDSLLHFFAKALRREPGRRYETAEEMRRAWAAVFAAARRPVTSSDGAITDEETLARLAEAATADTPVGELGLSGVATSALERLGLGNVGQLIGFPSSDLNRTPGIGLHVRREVLDAIKRVRSKLDAEPGDPGASIDQLAGQLVAKPTTPQAQADQLPLSLLLGLAGEGDQLGILGDGSDRSEAASAWPGPSDVRRLCQLDRAAYEQLIERAQARWLREPALTQVRHELASILERAGGILSGDELALALLAQRGSTDKGSKRLPRARAVVRAALEAEAARNTNRFTWRRLGGGAYCVIALRTEALEAEELADYAATLGTQADKLAVADPLLSPAAALVRLREVPTPVGLPPLSDHRLVRLAAAASATAEVSSRLELYPRGLPAHRAVRIARTALLAPGTLSAEEIHTRIRTRFPAAEPLPPRPDLDRLLDDTVGLTWFDGGPDARGAELVPGFRIPPVEAGRAGVTGSATRFHTGTTADVADAERVAAEGLQDRLTRQAAYGGYLVLTVRTRRHSQAIDALQELGATMINIDRILIDELRRLAEAKSIKWEEAIVAADAGGPEGQYWKRLTSLAREAKERICTSLLGGDEHVLVTYPGLLARYDELGLLDELRDRLLLPAAGQRLRTLWVLVPSDDPEAVPTIQGRAVPFTTSAERVVLADAWLRNAHRTHPSDPDSAEGTLK
jgi:serine/threonine protein kinase